MALGGGGTWASGLTGTRGQGGEASEQITLSLNGAIEGAEMVTSEYVFLFLNFSSFSEPSQ